jgi:sarcosine oxidase subunit beta
MGIVDLYDVSDDWIPVYDKSDLKGYDHDAAPMKFKPPHLGLTIDTGAFHRNRRINRDSSFSVIG